MAEGVDSSPVIGLLTSEKWVMLCLCLFVCQQDYSESYARVFVMKFVFGGTRHNRSDVGGDMDPDLDPAIFMMKLLKYQHKVHVLIYT